MRYKIVDESQSVHCCFTKTVVDTTRPVMIHGEHYDGKYEPVCECIDEEAAPVICNALNSVDRFRWIPVTERLPELRERVLVVNAEAGYVEVGFRHLVGEYHHWDGDDWEELHQPTHWMNLPEPPEVRA